MDYKFSLTVPANTSQRAPVTAVATLTPGVIRQVWLYFPWGCANLVSVAILHGLTQVWPSSPDVGYSANDLAIQFAENYELPVNEHELTLVGWSTDDTFSHTVIFRFTIESLAAARQQGRILDFLERFRQAVGF